MRLDQADVGRLFDVVVVWLRVGEKGVLLPCEVDGLRLDMELVELCMLYGLRIDVLVDIEMEGLLPDMEGVRELRDVVVEVVVTDVNECG